MEIILSVYACGPDRGSEIGLGWNWVFQLSNLVEVHVLTESEFRTDIEHELKTWTQKFTPKFYFIEIEGGDKTRKMCWNQGDYRFYYYYRKWQKEAYLQAKEIIANNNISITHHLNMIGYREPGYLWKIKEVPFILGPIGGFVSIKLRYIPSLGIKNGLFYFIKNILNYIQRLSPRVYKAFNSASLLFAANIESYNVINSFYSKNVILFNETGSKSSITNEIIENRNEVFTILWVGKFVARKALHIALESMHYLRNGAQLRIIGGGRDENKFKTYAKNNDLPVEWVGEIPHMDVINEMKAADLLLFTSLDEGTPHVVLESLACGLPVICHDICGQSTVINESCGIKIQLKSPKQSAIKFAKAIQNLLNDRKLHLQLQKGCVKRSETLSWENKAQEMYSFYTSLE